MDNEKLYYVATYGTLMRGQYNYCCMQDAHGQFIEPIISENPSYEMVDVHNSFPGIVHGESYFTGELFVVPESKLTILDSLEGYPILYDRIVIKYKGLDTNKSYSAITYVLSSSILSSNYSSQFLPSQYSKHIEFKNNTYKWFK